MTTGPGANGPPSPSRGVQRRLAFCPVCGGEQAEKPASQVGRPEDALCPGRCTSAWSVLLAVRVSESESETVLERRKAEREARLDHAPLLSELLLGRWRAGDWSVAPEDISGQL